MLMLRRYVALTDEPVTQQIGDPLAVLYVGFPTWHRLICIALPMVMSKCPSSAALALWKLCPLFEDGRPVEFPSTTRFLVSSGLLHRVLACVSDCFGVLDKVTLSL